MIRPLVLLALLSACGSARGGACSYAASAVPRGAGWHCYGGAGLSHCTRDPAACARASLADAAGACEPRATASCFTYGSRSALAVCVATRGECEREVRVRRTSGATASDCVDEP